MKHFSIIEQPTREAIKAFVEKRNLTEYFPQDYVHPQEDYLIASNELPIFVVSDGVTLNFKKLIEYKREYPNPSPAGEVAKIFCEAVQENAKNNYLNFNFEKIIEVFQSANLAVSDYNSKIGKSEVCGNPTGFYSATGAFTVIKENKAYWASICDAFFAHFDKNMNLKFMSTGTCSPYAVINGEERMAQHIERGVVDLQEGDKIFVFTDGFEHYVKNIEFLMLFKDWTEGLRERVEAFSRMMNLENPEYYGHERSLIVIEI